MIEDYLAQEMEGSLYAHLSVMPNIEAHEFWITKDFYTVKNGKVYAVEGDKLTLSGDTLLNTKTKCRRIGRYNPNKSYTQKHKTMTYSEIQKALF